MSTKIWPQPSLTGQVGGKIRIANDTDQAQTLKRHEHFCQVRRVQTITDTDNLAYPPAKPVLSAVLKDTTFFSDIVKLDPDHILPQSVRKDFQSVMQEFDSVFDPTITGYNGSVGPFQAIVNMGSVEPPQRKGRIPQYSKDKLQELQDIFDQLESVGVFRKPEDLNLTVDMSSRPKRNTDPLRYWTSEKIRFELSKLGILVLNSFSRAEMKQLLEANLDLEEMSTGSSSVAVSIPLSVPTTTLTDLSNFSAQASATTHLAISSVPATDLTILPTVQSAVISTSIIQTEPIPVTALTFATTSIQPTIACQRPRDTTTTRYVYSSVRPSVVYQTVPNDVRHLNSGIQTSTSVHNLSSFSDNLYSSPLLSLNVDSNSLVSYHSSVGLRHIPAQEQHSSLLNSMAVTNHSLSSAPLQSNVVFSQPNIPVNYQYNPNQSQVNLMHGSSSYPGQIPVSHVDTGQGYQGLAHVLQSVQSSGMPLEINPQLQDSEAQIHFECKNLKSARDFPAIVDELILVEVDRGYVKGPYTVLPFSQIRAVKKMQNNVVKPRLPITYDILVHIVAALRAGYFDSYTDLLLEAMFTVAFYGFLRIGAATSSAKSCMPDHMIKFLGRWSSNCYTRYIRPDLDMILPVVMPQNCQICNFISRTEDSVVRATTVQDIISGTCPVPFASRSAWIQTQSECPDLRRTHAHLKQGTRPSKKLTNIPDVKQYLRSVTISRDGLLVVKNFEPFCPTSELMVVPRPVLSGLLTAMHIKCNHPSKHQLKLVVKRRFYALDLEKSISVCSSLKKLPQPVAEQSTQPSPQSIGISFAADVLKRCKQLIFLLRETASTYTVCCLIDDERSTTLRNALARLCLEMRPITGPPVVVRVDPAPGFVALREDSALLQLGITLDMGRINNPNKNPVPEKAIAELIDTKWRISLITKRHHFLLAEFPYNPKR
ncbi:hypothetical protein LOTGIDRAFT_152267 [Lottia gigantea]|uniref:Integrase catalytic domain-containing protein n=1 Tax=Lottia gigantea TaxID=225164 RepID=V4BCL1_LOTGI|nr:hypothetical protein LOTGIDRAFT_152267 [Lottia gigantea]ESP05416.1 hypothetical protein LOTGIDRAFT_152267 [Lottia gigantea]